MSQLRENAISSDFPATSAHVRRLGSLLRQLSAIHAIRQHDVGEQQIDSTASAARRALLLLILPARHDSRARSARWSKIAQHVVVLDDQDGLLAANRSAVLALAGRARGIEPGGPGEI